MHYTSMHMQAQIIRNSKTLNQIHCTANFALLQTQGNMSVKYKVISTKDI